MFGYIHLQSPGCQRRIILEPRKWHLLSRQSTPTILLYCLKQWKLWDNAQSFLSLSFSLYTVVQWTWAPAFPQFLGPSEGSEGPKSCSIWLPLVSGFYRVVKHHCRLIYTHFVAVFRGKSDLLKIRKKLKYFCFWQNVYIKKMHFLLFLWTKDEIF